MKTIAALLLATFLCGPALAEQTASGNNSPTGKVEVIDAKELAILRRENSNLQVQVRILNTEVARLTKELKEATAPSADPFANTATAAGHDPFAAPTAEDAAKAAREKQAWRETNAISAELTIIQVLPGGILASGGGCYKRQYVTSMVETKGTGLDAHKMVSVLQTVPKPFAFEVGYVECPSAGLIDGQRVTTTIWPAGTYSYSNTLGAQKTVLKFTANP